MVNHSIKRSKVPVESGNDATMSGMLAVVNTLCQAVLPHGHQSTSSSPKTSAPLKKAELNGTYFEQLGEERALFDQGILNESEYEEQKKILINAVQKL